jgi:hypothetical protein
MRAWLGIFSCVSHARKQTYTCIKRTCKQKWYNSGRDSRHACGLGKWPSVQMPYSSNFHGCANTTTRNQLRYAWTCTLQKAKYFSFWHFCTWVFADQLNSLIGLNMPRIQPIHEWTLVCMHLVPCVKNNATGYVPELCRACKYLLATCLATLDVVARAPSQGTSFRKKTSESCTRYVGMHSNVSCATRELVAYKSAYIWHGTRRHTTQMMFLAARVSTTCYVVITWQIHGYICVIVEEDPSTNLQYRPKNIDSHCRPEQIYS